MAMVVPLLDLIISLSGSFFISVLVFIFPPIMDCLAKYPDKYGPGRWIIYKNFGMILIGIAALIIGTYFTVYEIVNKIYLDNE